jgi:N-acetylmuramoyl-L-alanine amidase
MRNQEGIVGQIIFLLGGGALTVGIIALVMFLSSLLSGIMAGGQPAYAGGSGFSGLTYPSGADPQEVGQCINEWFANKRADSPLSELGVKFATEGQRNNVNPALLIAIAGAESTYGTAWNAIAPSSHNYQSMRCNTSQSGPCIASRNSNPRTWEVYPNFEVAIERHAAYMQRKYLSQGVVDIRSIGEIYCGPTCNHWFETAPKVFNELVEACPQLNVVPQFSGSGEVGLEAGHSGKESGAVGEFAEVDLNRDIAGRVKNLLESQGIGVVYDPNNSYSRSRNNVFTAAQQANASLFVSLHNDFDKTWAAGTVLYQTDEYREQSIVLANALQPRINQVTGFNHQIDPAGPEGRGDHAYGDYAGMPFVLIEMSHVNDSRYNQESFKSEMARAIAYGIMEYFGK